MAAELFALVPVLPEVVKVVVALEQSVFLDHPSGVGMHVGLEDRCGELGVVVLGQEVADVMKKCRDHGLLVRAIALRARRGLERVRVTVDRLARIAVLEVRHVGEDPVRKR